MHRSLLSIITAFLFVVPALASPQPFGLNENHPYGRLTSDYASPHVAWGNPFYAGKIRALVIAPTWTQRETVELAQRLSLDYTPWMTASFTQVVAPAAADAAFRFFQPPPIVVSQALDDALKKDYDVIVVGKLDWQMVPPRTRLKLLERVAQGTGFLYINPTKSNKELELIAKGGPVAGAGEFILGGVPWSHLPALSKLAGDKLVKTAQFGKGRIVFLDYEEQAPNDEWSAASWPCLTPTWDCTNYAGVAQGPAPMEKLPEVQWVPYEYYQSLVAKAVVWAARKDSPIQVRIDIPTALPWPVAGKEIAVALSNAPGKTEIRAVVRDRYDRARTYPLKKAGVAFALPPLPCGDYFMDAWVMSRDGKTTYTWHSVFFAVTNEFAFSGLSLANTSINGGDTLGGAVTLSRPLQDGERLVLDLSDNYGRMIRSQTLPAASTTVGFSFVMPAPLTTMHRLQARLVRSGQDVACKTIQFPVRCRVRWNEFNEVSWGGGGGNNAIPFISIEKLVKVDEVDAFDAGWIGPTVARNMTLADGLLVPYQGRYGCFGGSTNHILDPGKDAYGCMSHPTTLEQLKKWGAEQSAMLGPYGPLAWTHGDETHYSADPDVCWCEYCLEVFHNYLKSVYPNLDALNAEWKTTYADWKAVMPVTFKEAKEKGVYAPWIEHCIANNRVFAGFYRKSSEALAVHDPGNRAGYDGGTPLESPNGGSDWWLLSRNIGILQSYMFNEESLEIIRSFATPQHLSGQWYGTYGLTWQMGPNTVPFCHFFPWNSVFHNLNSTWFWTMGNPGPIGGYAPDLTALPFYESRTEALRTIKHGVAALLLNSKRDNDGIAVFLSESSRIADALYSPPPSERSEEYSRCLADVNWALQDAGLQYQYISYDQVAQGDLVKQDYKVLFMPHSRSVSDAECKAIRDFVRNGGVVIADIMPAILNGHGSLQPASLLADLFPKGQTGVVQVVGKGKSVLIGDLIKGYGYAAFENQQGWKKLGDQPAKLAELLDRTAGVRPAVRIAHRGEGKMPPTEVTRFHAGDIQFVALLRSYWMYDNNPYSATVTFPKESYVYDMMNGTYLGFLPRIETNISYRAQLYALLPYKVRGVRVTGPRLCVAGQTAKFHMQVQAKGGAPLSKHFFRVEVFGPAEQPLPYYSANVAAEKGEADVTIPWALNEESGRYTVTARDVASGVKGSAVCQVKSMKAEAP